MSRSLELLALQKELLVTKASVQRLRLAHQAGVLREELRLPQLAKSAIRSTTARGALLPLMLLVAGRGGLARWLRRAGLLLSVASMAGRFMQGRTREPRAEEGPAAKG